MIYRITLIPQKECIFTVVYNLIISVAYVKMSEEYLKAVINKNNVIDTYKLITLEFYIGQQDSVRFFRSAKLCVMLSKTRTKIAGFQIRVCPI